MKNGENRNFDDYWDCMRTASVFGELYYASGTFTLTSRGSFILNRNNNTINITGTVRHRWHDDYDWHAGLSAYIPGFGNITDDDALLLQRHRGARPFLMQSGWSQSLSGQIQVINWRPDSVTFNWGNQ